MIDESTIMNLELIRVIVNEGKASKILKFARDNGLRGGTILLAQGTASNTILDFLGLTEVRKEVVYLIQEREKNTTFLKKLSDTFNIEKPNQGIIFTTDIIGFYGTKEITCPMILHDEKGDLMYHLITIIVDKGKAENVIDAAKEAGSKGGTIINARGSGIHETAKIFNFEIEPEKEMILILSEADTTQDIVDSIRRKTDIEQPGKGIIFIQNVNKTYGLYK
ncbi:nitrogen regulatory protein P-II [Peptoniphilus sp. ING2-D1G]|nr:nitrogen regulatory protein P-II [Peptoniphilus sp. ING2-D1G]